MSEAVTKSPGLEGQADQLPAGSLGLFDTTSSTLANIAPALSVFLTIPAIVIAMGTMVPWALSRGHGRVGTLHPSLSVR
jgi:hypothetical protein